MCRTLIELAGLSFGVGSVTSLKGFINIHQMCKVLLALGGIIVLGLVTNNYLN